MRCLLACVIIFGLFPSLLHAQATKETVDLGGPRKVHATITAVDRYYTVEVFMRPLRTFDEATNDEINQDLAREYALRALARHLSKGEDVQFTLGGESTLESGLKDGRYRLLIRWPKDRVKLLDVAADAPKVDKGTVTIHKPAFQGKLFTAKQDHLNTLKALRDLHSRTLATAAQGEPGKAFRKAVAVLEERGLQAFEQLTKVIKDDENLIDLTERPELLAAVQEEEKRFLEKLREAFAASELPPLSEKFTKVEITKPFDVYLRKNPLLMDLTGAILIEIGPERWVVIGIAKTILKDESPEEFLRAEKVCALKAKAAIIAERDGAQISYFKRVKDTIEIVKDENGEKTKSLSERTKITEERVKGMIKGMPVVGRWRSENGKLFYLAVGVVCDKKGEPVVEKKPK